MAMSKPCPTFQIVIPTKCELCNTDVDVNWFCKNCMQNLCDNCKRIHEKIPSLCTHDIGTIGEGRKFNRDVKILCTDHGEMLQYHCNPCLKDICIKCINVHLKHELVDLNEEGEKVREELRMSLESKKTQLAKLQQDGDAIKQHINAYRSTTDLTVAEIKSKVDEIIKLKETLLEQVNEQQRQDETTLRNRQQALDEAETSLQREIEKIENQIHNHTSLSLFHFIREDISEIDAVKTPDVANLPKPFVLSRKSAPDVKEIFGTLEQEDGSHDAVELANRLSLKRQPQVKLTVISLFVYNYNKKSYKYIYDISCTKDGTAWIASYDMPLQLVDHNGKVQKTVRMSPFAVYLAVSPPGEVMVSTAKASPIETKIKKISQGGSVSVFTEVQSCEAVLAMTVNLDQDLLTVLCGTNSVMYLAKIDKNGRELWRTKLGNYSSYTKSVYLSPDGNYSVMVGTEICVITDGGNVTERKSFDRALGRIEPITYDNYGNFVVGTKEGKIHVLNGKMECLQTYIIESKTVVRALAVDPNDRLWIGTDDGRVTVANYLE